MKQNLFHIAYAQILREVVPRDLDELHRSSTDLGQASMWLVGLASTLLVLAIANPERACAVLGDRYSAVSILFMITIAGGVLYRVLCVWLTGRVSRLMRGFLGYLVGYTKGVTLELPPELSDKWNEEEIVRRLNEHFGLDYGFLRMYKVPLAGCQDSYRGQYEIWKKQDQVGLEHLKKVMAAYMGSTEIEMRKLSEPTDDAKLAKIKHRAFVARGFWYLGSALFTTSALAFLIAMFYVARGLWSTPYA